VRCDHSAADRRGWPIYDKRFNMAERHAVVEERTDV
jgi:hypothetical protein